MAGALTTLSQAMERIERLTKEVDQLVKALEDASEHQDDYMKFLGNVQLVAELHVCISKGDACFLEPSYICPKH